MAAKKIVFWAAGGIVVLILLAVAAGFLLLNHSERFRAYLLQRVERSINESTGARATARDFKVSLSSLRLDFYEIVVHGREPGTERPLLTADHLEVVFKIDSVLGRKWSLQSLIADHPVASVSVNKAGESNLPAPQQPSQSTVNIFELAVRQAAIHNGEIYYNDQKMGIDATLNDLAFTAAFDPNQTRYYGGLRYSNGNIHYGQYAPVAHNLDARFEVTPRTFTLNQAQIATGSSRVVLEGSVEDYPGTPQIQVTYDAQLATRDLARVLRNSSVPAGDVQLTGLLNYRPRGDRPFLEGVKLAGAVSSRELKVATASFRGAIRDLKARYRLEDGNAMVDGLHAQLLGGSLDGGLTVRDILGAQKGTLHASLRSVSLDQALPRNQSLQQAGLKGHVDGQVEASWAKSLKNLIAHADAAFNGTLGSNPTTPVNGAVHADYSRATQQVALHQSYFRTAQTSIVLDGKVSSNSQLQVLMTSNNLHELELLAANFREAGETPSAPDSLNLGLYGSARLAATVAGSLDQPQIRGKLEATNFRVKGSTWRTLHTDVSANPSVLALENGELQAATQGRFTFNVRVGLAHWSYMPANPINLTLYASQLSVADLQKFAGKDYPIAGTLAMNVSLHGSQLNPSGQGKITLTNGVITNETIQNITLNFQGDGNSVHADLAARLPAGSAKGEARVDPKTGSYDFQFHAAGLRLDNLEAVKARHVEISGAANIDASGTGTVEQPQMDATLAIPELHIRTQTIHDATLHATIRNQVATIDLGSSVEGTSVKANGTVGIKAPYMADVRLDTSPIQLRPLVALYSPARSENVSGQTELHATLRGPLGDKERLEGHVEMPALAVTYREFQIGSTKPIRLDYQNGVAVLQPVELNGTDTAINVQATIPVRNLNAATLTLKGAVDLRVAQLLVPDLKSSGQVRLDIDSRGVSSAGMSGQISIVDASLHHPDVPLGLDHANGVIKVSPTRLDVSSFKGEMGGGTVTARGGATFRPAVQFDLGLEGDNVRLRYPEGIRALLVSSLALTGTPQAATLGGRVLVERLSFTPDFDLASFARQFEGPTSAPVTTGGFMQSVRLNVALQSAAQMNLESSQVSIRGTANLRLVGTAAQPVVLGRTDLTGGELFFGSHRYVVQSGTVDFLNPVRTEPVLNLQVRTRINEYDITLSLEGPATRLHTTFTSDPALPPADIINLIASGQTTEAAGAQPSQPLALGAQSLVASAVSSQIGNRIAKIAGISQLGIDPSFGSSNGQNPGARIAIQQRVTSNLFLTISTDVTSTQRQSIQLEYDFNPRWSVTGVRDQNGGVTALGHYRKKF
ncbi:MAG TPA: translocation/assembly module TamB domain-containing protein [Candidatus Angelobacter sp.]|nr:translocation/assembly module TamB domain-containing protein [Candidatus Angelobacter sp.]